MHIRISAVLLSVFAILQLGTAQQKFHRTYPSVNSKDILCISSTQMKDGNYLALELEIERDANNEVFSDTLIITSYKPKGDINWTKAIGVEMSLNGYEPALGSIVQGDNDSIYYSIITKSLTSPNKVIGAMGKGGADGWMKSYSSVSNIADGTAESHLLANYNKSIFNTYIGGTSTENDLALSRKNYAGKNIWSKLLAAKDDNGDDLSESITHLSFEADSTLLLSGIVDSNNVASFITIADTLGNVKWSKKYSDLEALIGFPFAYDAVRMPDSTYIIGGLSVEIDATFNFSFKGFLIKTTKNGDVDWGKKVIFNDDDITTVKHIALDKDKNILVAGFNFDAATQEAYNFVTKIRSNGTVIWKKKYPRVGGTLDFTGALFSTKDGGSAFINSVIEDSKVRPSFIKLDNDGSSSCEENIEENILIDNSYGADTLVWTSRSAGEEKAVTFASKPYAYDVAVVTLEVRPFCPNEPIDWTFRIPPIKGATDYQWSTGTNRGVDSLRVFEEGEYSVTVTINEGVCFMLCDTSKLARYDKPQAQLKLAIGNFCSNNKMRLDAGYIPGHPQIKSITWSTDETGVQSIEIAQAGTYKVTIVDQCDESATAEIATGAFPKKITTATISSEVAVDCYQGQATGILTASGNTSGLGVEKYKWSTGAETQNININDIATTTYTVTVTDGCGGTASSSFTSKIEGPGVKSVSIVLDKSRLCAENLVKLNAVTDKNGRFKYVWSQSAVTPDISVKDPGTYSVTVTDVCGNTATATKAISEDDLSPQTLKYAHVFFPDGTDYRFEGGSLQDTMAYKALSLNRTFGPINTAEYCIDDIQNYEFYIFNRWGQKVFESNNIKEEWDGMIKDQKAQGDTYVWVAKYTIFGFTKTVKGDVTMIRL